VRYNPQKIKVEVKGISVVITTKIMGKMLHLPVSGIHTPPTMLKDETQKLCLKFIDKSSRTKKKGGEFLVSEGRIYFKC
jgi:hypothetical protein